MHDHGLCVRFGAGFWRDWGSGSWGGGGGGVKRFRKLEVGFWLQTLFATCVQSYATFVFTNCSGQFRAYAAQGRRAGARGR